jgi:hypothetical protein
MSTLLKIIYYRVRKPIFKIRGYQLLDLTQTITFMKRHLVRHDTGMLVQLPHVVNAGDLQTTIFEEKQIVTDDVYVWKYHDTKRKGKLSKYGSLVLKGKVLCTDWSTYSFYKDIWKRDTRAKKDVPAFIALFSHYQDGILHGGYFDFVFLIATKLCRIKDTFPEIDFSQMFISYPIFKSAYETELLQLLDIDISRIVDSRECQLRSSEIITANIAHWYPHLEDILSLKKYILQKITPAPNTGKRIYIGRSCRRNIINEDELIPMLKSLDFTIIEDNPRSISEQISIYYNASFIIGPHGASFSNIIWCKPGTHLMELFMPDYVPDFFLYLATIMGISYSAYYEGVKNPSADYRESLVKDIYVSVPKLEMHLKEMLYSQKCR